MKALADSTDVLDIRRGHVPTAAALEAWTGHEWDAGVQVDQLRDLDSLRIRTRNTLYDITLLRAGTGEAVVIGGRFFPEHRHALVLGCSLGGALLKLRGIYCGFSLELYATGTRIVTSPIQSIEVLGDHRMRTVQ